MLDKERLEELISRKPNRWSNLTIYEFERDIKILQEQAERVEELEKETERLKDALSGSAVIFNYSQATVKELTEKNKRYREALEFYAGGKHVAYKLDETDDDLVVDYGEMARKALEESE